MYSIHPEIDFPEADHILKALRLNRTPGWSFPAYHLGLGFHAVSAQQAVLGMDVTRNLDAQGRPLGVALAVFADLSLAAGVRGRVADDVRLATVSASLSFTGVAAKGPLRAASTCHFLAPDGAMTIANTAVSLTSGDTILCTGTANFAVLDNRMGTAPHPRPGVHDVDTLQPLPLNELTASEEALLARARRASHASRSGGGAAFLDHFWGLIPDLKEHGPECVSPCGMHVGNRVGHTQGGILLGLAMNTSAAAPGPGWRVLDVSANFHSPGQGKHLHAVARLLRTGRSLAQVMCEIRTDDGTLVLSALSTLVREGSPD